MCVLSISGGSKIKYSTCRKSVSSSSLILQEECLLCNENTSTNTQTPIESDDFILYYLTRMPSTGWCSHDDEHLEMYNQVARLLVSIP